MQACRCSSSRPLPPGALPPGRSLGFGGQAGTRHEHLIAVIKLDAYKSPKALHSFECARSLVSNKLVPDACVSYLTSFELVLPNPGPVRSPSPGIVSEAADTSQGGCDAFAIAGSKPTQ